MKIVASILAVIILVGIVFIGIHTFLYMRDYELPIGNAITNAWDDLLNIRIKPYDRNEVIIGYDHSNIYPMVGCATW